MVATVAGYGELEFQWESDHGSTARYASDRANSLRYDVGDSDLV